MENLEFIKSLTRDEVLKTWERDESKVPHWKPFWEAKGYKSWTEWRGITHEALFGKPLAWNLYKVAEPLANVPEWRGGMFHGWAKWFYPVLAEQPPKLKDLLAHPGVHNHWFVLQIGKNFHTPTTIIAVRLPNGDICVAEGMHRCCALTLMAHEKSSAKIELNVILADWPDNDPPKLGHWEKEN
jgi:hypothetical protein